MRLSHYTLNRKDVHQHAGSLLQTWLHLADYSRKCTVSVLLHVLFYAASRITSVSAACARLRQAPCDATVLKALLATLPAYADLQTQVNRALRGQVPKAWRRRRQRLAIDLTLIPYHGQPFADVSEIYRSLAKSGTSHFHAYASAYVVCQGQRYTVALTPVTKGEALKDVVQRLLREAAQASLRPRLLLLDRGFFSVEVIRYLQCARVPFLMPTVARGRKPKKGEAATGLRAFQQWKTSGWGQHTLTNSSGRRATVAICVCCGNYRGGRGRRGRFAWVYAYWGLQPGPARTLGNLGCRNSL